MNQNGILPKRAVVDYDRHNAEVEAVWAAYRKREPIRVPLIFGINARLTMFDHPANPRGIEFAEYSSDPEIMIERQVEHQAWVRENIPQDAPMGRPKDGWRVNVDLQNVYEAGWYGAEIIYRPGQVPDSAPLLADDDRKWQLIERGAPDPFTSGTAAKMWDFYEHMLHRMEEGREYDGLPIVHVDPPAGGSDGPLTICCNLRGAGAFFTDLLDDPDYAHAMLDFVTETTITRIKAYRERTGQDSKPKQGGLADDSVQLISTPMFRELILPYHRRFFNALYGEGPHSMHLCGDATRHFRTIRDELNVWSFDTGFPVDFTWLRKELGPDVEILGGPSVPFLETATPNQVTERVKEILGSGITEGGRFMLREGNNLPPGVSLDNINAMWYAVHEYSRY